MGIKQGIKTALMWVYTRLKMWQWGAIVCVLVAYVLVAHVPVVQRHVHSITHTIITTLGLRVHHVLLEGRLHADKQQISNIILDTHKTSIFGVGLVTIQKHLMQLGWVKHATVSRIYPDMVFVHIEEHTPIAIWQSDGVLSLIDKHGMVISRDGIADFTYLKVVVGDGAQNQAQVFLDLIATDKDLEKLTQTGVYVSKRRWDVILKNGVRIQLPVKDAVSAWKKLGDLVRNEALLARPLKLIDMRIKGRIQLELDTQKKDKST